MFDMDIFLNKLSNLDVNNSSNEQNDLYLKCVIDMICKNKNISYSELSFIIKYELKSRNLLSLCDTINNRIVDNAYGDMKINLFILRKSNCEISIDYDRLCREYKNNYKDLIFQLLYISFHEIEHVNQVNFMMDANNFKDDDIQKKRLAISYKQGFFLEEKIGNTCNNYDNLIIEYNAKLIGMINAIRFIENYFSNLYDSKYINKMYLEVSKLIKENANIYSKNKMIFEKYKEEYYASDYLVRCNKDYYYNYTCNDFMYFNNEFLNNQFILLLLGSDNVFNKVIMNKDISYNIVCEMLERSIVKKGSKK